MKNKTLKSIIIGSLVGASVLAVSAYSTQIWDPIQYVKKLFITSDGSTESSKATITFDGITGRIDAKSVYVNGKNVKEIDKNAVGNKELKNDENYIVKGLTASGDWVRVKGKRGLYFQDYGGGWYMTDKTWIRSYGNKNVYVNKAVRADDGFSVDGITVISKNGGAIHTAQYTGQAHYGYFEVRNKDGKRGAYFGRGNGGNTVNLTLDNASTLSINKNVSIGKNLKVSGSLSVKGVNVLDRANSAYALAKTKADKSYVDSKAGVTVCNSTTVGKINNQGKKCKSYRICHGFNIKHCKLGYHWVDLADNDYLRSNYYDKKWIVQNYADKKSLQQPLATIKSLKKCKHGFVLTSTDGKSFQCVGTTKISIGKFSNLLKLDDGIGITIDGYAIVDTYRVHDGCNNKLIPDRNKCIAKIEDLYLAPANTEIIGPYKSGRGRCSKLKIGGLRWSLPSINELKKIHNWKNSTFGIRNRSYRTRSLYHRYNRYNETYNIVIGSVSLRGGPTGRYRIRCVSK